MATSRLTRSRKLAFVLVWWVFVTAFALSYVTGVWSGIAGGQGATLIVSTTVALVLVGFAAATGAIVGRFRVSHHPVRARAPDPEPVSRRLSHRRPSPAVSALLMVFPLVGLLGLELAFRTFGPDPADQPWVTMVNCPSPGWCGASKNVRRLELNTSYAYRNDGYAEEFVPLAEHPGGGFLFRTNGFGLRRDDDVAIPKPPGVFRVLMLGDSQVEGLVNNDEHYPHELEELLRTHARLGQAEVLNAGVGGYGPQHSYHWYLARGATLAPDLVVLNLYLGNDLFDFGFGDSIDGTTIPAVRPPLNLTQSVESGFGAVGQLRRFLEITTTWLRAHSRLYQAAANWILDGPLTTPLTRVGLLRPELAQLRLPRVWQLVNRCHGCWSQQFAQVRKTSPARLERARAGLATLLSSLKHEVGSRGGQLLVVSIPTKLQVEPADAGEDIELSQRLLMLTPEDLQSPDSVLAMVHAAADEADVMIIDPTPALIEAAQTSRLYYRRDWHLNPNGHRALAEYVAQELMRGPLPLR